MQHDAKSGKVLQVLWIFFKKIFYFLIFIYFPPQDVDALEEIYSNPDWQEK